MASILLEKLGGKIQIHMNEKEDFQFIDKLSEKIEISLPDGRFISGRRGATLQEFLSPLDGWDGSQIVGAVVDGTLKELTTRLERACAVQPVNMSTSDGSKIYRRSLTFLLETAFDDLFPEHFLAIDHSVPSGGYFCSIMGREPLTRDEIHRLEQRMKKLVEENLVITKEKVTLEEARAYFEEKGYIDKIRLLKYRKKDYLVLYQLENHKDYHHGYMVPSTGYLKVFKLHPRGEGFIVQYPRRATPNQLFPMPRYSKLLKTFKQYGSWLKSLDIDSVGALNNAIETKSIREVILVSEALQEQKISQIASRIAGRKGQIKVVLISGPTSSGKTTFSKRLAVQLLAYGITPFALEMDNYFVDREKTPKDVNGNFDFESFEALDAKLMEIHIKDLMRGKEVTLPYFNFKSGLREEGQTIRLNENQVILIEGIHGLNPGLFPQIPKQNTFRIYTSCLTQLNLDYYNRISTTDTRMLRRIVRDAQTRGYSPQRTIDLWDSVRRGERDNIFPYQENADEIFNSALVYELSALKPYVEPLLRQIPYGTFEHLEAKRLLAFLDWFLPIDSDFVPDNSILREFIGNSFMSDFHLWNENGRP
ncbi:MAG: uridine kinase [Chloroflexota bacterium]|nr:uridine kinase [Chloroflexota bacterium]